VAFINPTIFSGKISNLLFVIILSVDIDCKVSSTPSLSDPLNHTSHQTLSFEVGKSILGSCQKLSRVAALILSIFAISF